MRILFVVRRLNMGGIQTATLLLAKILANAGHEVHIFVQKGKPTLEVPKEIIVHAHDIDKELRKNIRGFFKNIYTSLIISRLIPGSKFIWQAKDYVRLFKKHLEAIENQYGKFDLIISRGEGSFEKLAAFDDKRFFIQVEGNPDANERRFFAPFIYRALYTNKKIIAVSKGIAQVLEDSLKRHQVKTDGPIRIIYNFLNQNEIIEKSNEKVIEDLNSKYIVHVGRLHRDKNQELVLSSFAKLNKLDPNIRLIMVGGGEEREKLEKLAKDLQIDKLVQFVGLKHNPYPYIKHAKAFLLTSKMEGLGMVVLDSLMLGVTPVACNGKGGIRDIMVGELANNLVDFDEEKIAQKLLEVINNPTKITSDMFEKFTPEAALKSYELLYKSTKE